MAGRGDGGDGGDGDDDRTRIKVEDCSVVAGLEACTARLEMVSCVSYCKCRVFSLLRLEGRRRGIKSASWFRGY